MSIRWRLFLTYLVVVSMAVGIVAVSAHQFAASHMPEFFHTNLHGSPMKRGHLFLQTIDESLIYAGASAIGIALALSFTLSRTLIGPVTHMMRVTQRIANGNYAERASIHRVDELGKLAASLNVMAFRLEQTEEMRRKLITDVTHELSTPLTSMQGMMEGLLDGVFPPDRETFTLIHQETVRLQQLVHNLKELSILESRSLSLDIREYDLILLLHAVIQKMGPSFLDKQIHLSWEHVPPPVPILADSNRMTQVFTNLLSNALRYTTPGGRVSVHLVVTGQEAVVIVRDSGIGIAAHDLPHIFERFYRADRSRARSTGGSGVGLSIVKEIVELHGGSIEVTSEVNHGSCFRVSLPLLHEENDAHTPAGGI